MSGKLQIESDFRKGINNVREKLIEVERKLAENGKGINEIKHSLQPKILMIYSSETFKVEILCDYKLSYMVQEYNIELKQVRKTSIKDLVIYKTENEKQLASEIADSLKFRVKKYSGNELSLLGDYDILVVG